jgi:hypothetical protein
MSEKRESERSEQAWHSRHQRADDLPSYSPERWQAKAGDDGMCFVARASGRIHDDLGNGIGEGEWRVQAWPGAPMSGPEAHISLAMPWHDVIAESAKAESLGGIALDLASCERLAEAATHAAAVLRAGRWVERPAGDAEATHQETLRQLAEVTAERDALKRRVAELEAEVRSLKTYDHFSDL